MRPGRFELPACGLGNRRSIRLSYGRASAEDIVWASILPLRLQTERLTRMPKMKAYATFDLYLAEQRPKNQAVIRALRRFVKRIQPKLVESVKWGNGCWLNGKQPVAYVYAGEPEYTQFGFVYGSKLDDPKKLLEGKGAYVRHIKVRTPRDIDARAFAALLRQAVKRTPLRRPG